MADDTSDPERLLAAVSVAFQSIEDAGQQVLLLRDVNTALGAQLRRIGRIVGQIPASADDEIERRYIRARIATNRSSGSIPDILRIARLVLGDDLSKHLVCKNWGAASFELLVDQTPVLAAIAQILIDFLLDACAAGVRPIATSGSGEPSTWLRINRVGLGIGQGHLVHSADH